ncbi:MAG: hypothetical protein KC418_14695 [Anaerolineales bacterium]|nr:hypothetical protein [Anaerolineales bacterium]MCB8953440.1 hypothetical protein [Ardenticatenales bacterium]
MIRLFDLRDLALVHRLSGESISFHAESALTSDVHPVRSALAGMLMGRPFSTYIWKADENGAAGFVQLQLREEGAQAQLIRVGLELAEPAMTGEQQGNGDALDIWLPLMDQLAVEAGQQGVQHLIAEVSELGDELPLLRRAGFAVYTRKDVWMLRTYEAAAGPQILTPRKSVDDWDIHLLYANIVPRLIQLVEPSPPLQDGAVWVLHEDGEMTALVQRRDGPGASWLSLFIHPGAHMPAETIIAAALQLKPPEADRPLYCCVPRYQGWLQNILPRLGFRLSGSYAVMVRHIVKRAPALQPERAAVIASKQVAGSTPFISHPPARPKQRS